MEKQGCPVCGFQDITVLDDFNCTTFEICECCGSESGFEYNQNSTIEHFAKVRYEWVIENSCDWWGEEYTKPSNWNPFLQMKLANIEIPQK